MNMFFCYPKCSTCKSAQKFLDVAEIPYQSRNIKEDTPTEKEVREWIFRYGIDIRKLWNTSGILYRELGLKDKLPNMTEDEKIDLLISNGMLIKRPILAGENFILIGFKEKEWKEKLCHKS